ncbi:MAG TPA: hypothetical protein VGB00_16425, partial [Pyrinomonadaceae bacterium]
MSALTRNSLSAFPEAYVKILLLQMFSSNPVKSFHLVVFFSICLTACGFWSKGDENSNAADPTPFTAREIPSEIPFSNREPDVFQCEIVVSTSAGGEKTERKTFVARNGARRLTIFAAGEKTEVSLLQLNETGFFSIQREKKVYTENALNRASPVSNNEAFSDFLTVARLNAKASGAFENVGAENGLSKFRVRLNDSETSEILIYVDENLKIPVKQEFYS